MGARPNQEGINVVKAGISNTMNTPVEELEMRCLPRARWLLHLLRRSQRRRLRQPPKPQLLKHSTRPNQRLHHPQQAAADYNIDPSTMVCEHCGRLAQ